MPTNVTHKTFFDVLSSRPVMESMKVHLIFELGNAVLGFLSALYVIYLALYCTRNRDVQVYRKMLILNAVIDLLYVVSTTISVPNVVFASDILFILWENPFVTRRPFDVFACMMIQTYFIYFSVVVLPIQFIYRYSVVSSNGCKFSTIVKILACCITYLLIHCSFLSYTYQAPNETYDQMLREQGIPEEDLVYVAGDKHANWWLLPHFGSCMLMVIASYTTITVVYIKTQKVLRRFEIHMTASTRRAQRQMTRIILLQAFYPIVLLCLPSFFFAFAPIINFKSDYLGIICVISIHLTPLLNSMSVVFCVPSYRRTTKRFIGMLLRCEDREIASTETSNIKSLTKVTKRPQTSEPTKT